MFEISREEIARMADLSAQRYSRTGRLEANPFAVGTDEAKAFSAAFERFHLLHTAPTDADLEGGA